MSIRITKPMQQAMDQKFIAAFNKYFTAKKTKVTIDEEVYSPDQVVSTIQGQVDAETNVETMRGQYAQAVAAAKATVAKNKALFAGAKQMVLVMYASNPAVLTEFGLSARKLARAPGVDAKQAAVTLAKATRLARHTMGPRQREQIKGAVAPASSDVVAAAPSVAPIATANAGSNPVASNGVSVGSTVTTLNGTGH